MSSVDLQILRCYRAHTFLLGRMADCHLCAPGDPQVSHHHFQLEACPPMASLRDLGSMNGTHLNGKNATVAIEAKLRNKARSTQT